MLKSTTQEWKRPASMDRSNDMAKSSNNYVGGKKTTQKLSNNRIIRWWICRNKDCVSGEV